MTCLTLCHSELQAKSLGLIACVKEFLTEMLPLKGTPKGGLRTVSQSPAGRLRTRYVHSTRLEERKRERKKRGVLFEQDDSGSGGENII